MLVVGSLLVLFGYTLVYAAVANGGILATNPSAGLTTDAYTGQGPVNPLAARENALGITVNP